MNFEDCSHTLIDVHTIFIISPRTFIYIYIYLERERERERAYHEFCYIQEF